MAEISYVVLSDLHFGATNSVLTDVRGMEACPNRPTPLLEGLVEGLRVLTAGQAKKPTLVLAGDVLDLALSADEVAAAAFEVFVDLVFPSARRVFEPVVHYVPGNHDHHLWESAREAQYVTLLSREPRAPVSPPWHVTCLLPGNQPPIECADLLGALIRRRPGCDDVTVKVSYPNMALASRDGTRCRVISHGHFTEPIYSLMSTLKDVIFPPGATRSLTVEELEEENFAWIDFFWSTLGRSGQVGTDVGLIYARLADTSDVDALCDRLVEAFVSRETKAPWLRPVERPVLKRVVGREVNKVAGSERGAGDQTLTQRSREGLTAYLAGAVAAQVRTELGAVPDDLSFIWGHTHKPFSMPWSVPGRERPVQVYNTGGWVVDTAGTAPMQGGAAVLVDDNLDVACLQLYRQSDGTGVPVQVLRPVGEFGQELARSVSAASEPWASVSRAASELVSSRHRLQRRIVEER